MVTTDDVLDYIEETGSTWMNLSSDASERNPDLVYREDGTDTYVSHPWYKKAEEKISKFLISRVRSVPQKIEEIDKYIEDFENEEGFTLCDEQKQGVRMFCTSWLGILTGGPGTGKTSVLKCAFYVLKHLDNGCSVLFTAPTGKAAMRMEESIGVEAYTIQSKLLGKKGEWKKIYVDYLFIDETSMLDEDITFKLANCVSNKTKLFFIGDPDQLPSVGEGAVLRDMVESGCIPMVQLQRTFRQDNSSKLFENIQIIKQGGHIPLEEGTDFKVFRTEKDVFKLVVKEYQENVQKYGVEQTVILSPYRKYGDVCSKKLNSYLQKAINPDGEGIKTRIYRDGEFEFIEFREGDPVMHLKNNEYCSNGETGIITKVNKYQLTVQYPNKEIYYNISDGDLENLDLAYALSINKSQGSEYKCVIIPVLKEFENLSKNMIYTAVTRAKSICEVIGENDTIEKACGIDSTFNRRTFLQEELEVSRKQMALIAQVIGA